MAAPDPAFPAFRRAARVCCWGKSSLVGRAIAAEGLRPNVPWAEGLPPDPVREVHRETAASVPTALVTVEDGVGVAQREAAEDGVGSKVVAAPKRGPSNWAFEHWAPAGKEPGVKEQKHWPTHEVQTHEPKAPSV